MPLKESEAIVLRTFPLGEGDRLVSFLDRHVGRGHETMQQRPAFLGLEIEGEAFYVVGYLVPLVEGFDVDGADDFDAVAEQALHEMTADKSTGAADDCFLSFEVHSGGRTPFQRFTRLKLLS